MITDLKTSWIWSENIDRLRAFYTDVLGLRVAMEPPGGMLMFGPDGGPYLGIGTHSDVKGMNLDPARHIVSVGTDDIEAEASRLKAAGVEFIQDPENMGMVSIATFKDPDGNFIQLLQMN